MKIKDILAGGRPSVSFEIFPPRKDAPFAPVKEAVERLARQRPSFMSVTYGAAGGARYVFGIDPALGPADLAEPLIDIKFDTSGKPYVKLPVQANTDGATVTVLATEDILDWTGAVEVPVDMDTGLCYPVIDPSADKMFFKWRILFDW